MLNITHTQGAACYTCVLLCNQKVWREYPGVHWNESVMQDRQTKGQRLATPERGNAELEIKYRSKSWQWAAGATLNEWPFWIKNASPTLLGQRDMSSWVSRSVSEKPCSQDRALFISNQKPTSWQSNARWTQFRQLRRCPSFAELQEWDSQPMESDWC